MKGIIQWMAANHVAANLLMFIFIVGGLVIGKTVKQEVFPEIELDRIQVSVIYPGAGPEEIEEGIILKIEESLTGVDGIKQITAIASEGSGSVIAEIYSGEDADQILQDIKSEVDRITTFPEDAEKAIISKMLNRREAISLVVYGDIPERSLRELAEQVRDELLEFDQITQVDLGGVRPYEISININEETLRRYELTLEEVAHRVRQASLDLPGGTIKTDRSEILIRTKERRDFGPEYEEIRLLSGIDGSEIRLGDIAEIDDGFEESDLAALFNGKPASMVKVYRIGNQKPTEISKIVMEYIEEKQSQLPPSVQIADWNDTSEVFRSRMHLLLKNAGFGLALVLIVLGLFLEVRLALWVMLGIPISFLGSLLLMPSLDVSINMISLFAFIMALGIVVDDAIVVGENIYEHRQRGKPFLQAAVDGAYEVSTPVIFAILTSVTAFMPLLYVTGTMGKFIRVIPMVVISILVISLVECLFVLPAHLSLGKQRRQESTLLGRLDKIRAGFGTFLTRFIGGPYRRFLTLSLHYRYTTVAVAVCILAITFGLVGGGIIKFRFMPKVAGNTVKANLEMISGTPASRTAEAQHHLFEKAMQTIKEFEEKRSEKIVRHVYSVTGGTIAAGGPRGGSSSEAANLAGISLFLTPSEDRVTTSEEIGRRWRQLTGDIPGTHSLSFASNLVHMGANIDVRLAHERFDVLEKVSERLQATLADYPGVDDIASNFSLGKKELKIKLRSEARTLGITEEQLGRQLRSAFYGAEALRLQRGRNEVKVMVRYPEDERRHLEDLETMRIRTPSGGEIPLYQAASVEEGYGFSSIHRSDRKRVINVTADVDSTKANAEEIILELQKTILSELKTDYPGLGIDLEGESKERRDSMGSMGKGFMLALLFIYALLALPFRSYSQPLLIMAAIPFGIIGAIFGHLIMGYDLSIMSMFGIVALSGVVVNDSLLLIDYANRSRRKGMDKLHSIIEAGVRRFRPILLTSLTTFFGLSPMILETSTQAKFLIPMAISLAFGIMAATGITLLLIPSLYLILEDFRHMFGFRDEEVEEG